MCEKRDGWLVAWGLCGFMLIRLSTVASPFHSFVTVCCSVRHRATPYVSLSVLEDRLFLFARTGACCRHPVADGCMRCDV